MREIDFDKREYIVQDRDGHFLAAIESSKYETVKFFFRWSKHRKDALQMKAADLWARGDATCMMLRLAQGHAGCKAIRVR